MSRGLPHRPPVDVEDESQVVSLQEQPAGDVFGTLSCSTARDILLALYDEPATGSQVADRVSTSIQNAQHHLENLREAGLVTEAGTWYSSKGREMTVYAPANRPLVIVAAPDDVTAGAADDGGEPTETLAEAVAADPSDDDVAAPTAD
jgi:DNA-binding transcriptional ArsR family regulator